MSKPVIRPDPLKPYAWCWIHTKANDCYFGRISLTKFIGNNLTLKVSPLFLVQKDQSDVGFRVLHRNDAYNLDFERCKLDNYECQRWEFISSIGDKIILIEEQANVSHVTQEEIFFRHFNENSS